MQAALTKQTGIVHHAILHIGVGRLLLGRLKMFAKVIVQELLTYYQQLNILDSIDQVMELYVKAVLEIVHGAKMTHINILVILVHLDTFCLMIVLTNAKVHLDLTLLIQGSSFLKLNAAIFLAQCIILQLKNLIQDCTHRLG